MKSKLSKKQRREKEVLFGLIELYMQYGKPVGSETLKESGFEHLSSATIRNYFSQMEEKGLLKQAHTSGGRFPTQRAFALYFEEAIDHPEPIDEELKGYLRSTELAESKHVNSFLETTLSKIAEKTKMAAFLSSPRFDHDFILEIKLVHIDANRLLSVLITDFGQILTEILNVEEKLSSVFLRKAQDFFTWKLSRSQGSAPSLSEQEMSLASTLYNEILVRYIARYSNFSDEDITKTGFSNLLNYTEFQDPLSLTNSLGIFEDTSRLRMLLSDCVKHGDLKAWIGQDLTIYAPGSQECSVIAIPYKINHIHVGAVGILGPLRMPYKQVVGILKEAAKTMSLHLTKNLYKFKLSFRQPRQAPFIDMDPKMIMDKTER